EHDLSQFLVAPEGCRQASEIHGGGRRKVETVAHLLPLPGELQSPHAVPNFQFLYLGPLLATIESHRGGKRLDLVGLASLAEGGGLDVGLGCEAAQVTKIPAKLHIHLGSSLDKLVALEL